MTSTLFNKITSTRYIFLLSGLAFILWSLVTSIAPKSSTLSALLQMDLDQTMAKIMITQHSKGPNATGQGIGIPRAHIYVVSLADRQDRQEQMAFLRTIQDLTWTVVDATPGNATLIHRILDRVLRLRAESKKAGTSTFRWPEEIDALAVSTHAPLTRSGSDTWADAVAAKPSGPKSGSGKSGASTYAGVACAIEDDGIPTFGKGVPAWMTLSPAKIACWHSHVSAIRQFVEKARALPGGLHRGGDNDNDDSDVAVLLEDDVDMERNVSARLAQVWTSLPPGWDIVFLGHCWSDESHYPSLTAFADTNLHPAYAPKCTHAYVLSLSGARRLLQHLRYPPFAYSRALDQAYAWLVRSGRLRGYSIFPSVVVQRKSGRSDILPGPGSEWKEGLQDGVFGSTT